MLLVIAIVPPSYFNAVDRRNARMVQTGEDLRLTLDLAR
jgi:hypothetical protein